MTLASLPIVAVYAYRTRLMNILLMAGLFVVSMAFVPATDYIFESVLKPHQQERILSYLGIVDKPQGIDYNVNQSKIAIGSGGLFGKGFLQGTQIKYNFVPEKHTDFAIAVLGEEWGFAGCMALVTLFCLFLCAIYNTVRDAKDRFGSTLAAGIFFYFFWQIIVNIGMVVGLMPVVGMPLPFISYGGNAMMVNCALLGIVLNVSMRRFVFKG